VRFAMRSFTKQQQLDIKRMGKTSHQSVILNPHVHSIWIAYPFPKSLRKIRIQTYKTTQISNKSRWLRTQTM